MRRLRAQLAPADEPAPLGTVVSAAAWSQLREPDRRGDGVMTAPPLDRLLALRQSA
jgi:hypothetical protein